MVCGPAVKSAFGVALRFAALTPDCRPTDQDWLVIGESETVVAPPLDRWHEHWGRPPEAVWDLWVGMSAVPTQVLLVSQCDAARMLGVERTTIWRMCGRGDLAQVRIGRRTLITMQSINAYIASQVESVGDRQRS